MSSTAQATAQMQEVKRVFKLAAAGFAAGFVGGLFVGHPFAGGFAVVGLMLVVNGLRVLPRWKQARGITEQPIGSIGPASGAVEVVGRAQGDGETTTAPLTDTPCLAYVIEMEEYRYRSGGRHSSGGYRWVDAGGDMDNVDFLLEDHSGLALVETSGAEFFLDAERELELEEEQQPPASLGQMLERAGYDVVCDAKRRYTEYRLDEGEEIHVSAEANAPPDRPGTDGRQPSVALTDGPSTPLFSIATDPDKSVSGELLWRAVSGAIMGASLIGAAVAGAMWGAVGGIGAIIAGIVVLMIIAAVTGRGEFMPN